jgi:hypothetical protein
MQHTPIGLIALYIAVFFYTIAGFFGYINHLINS